MGRNSQHTYEIRKLQPRFTNAAGNVLRGCFFTVDSETREYHYERSAGDPRVLHSLALEVDGYGTVLQSALVAYPRRSGSSYAEQNALLCVVSDLTVAHVNDASGYRLAIPLSGKTYELTGLTATQSAPTSPSVLKNAFASASSLEYHQSPTTGLQKRIVEHIKLRYYDTTNLPNPRAFGTADVRALVYETYQLDSTADLLSQVDGKVTSTILTEGGYVTPVGETGNWIPSGRSLPDSTKFYLPTSFTDPFTRTTYITYDAHNLLVTQIADPLSNTVSATHGYRTLAPTLLTDPNGNRVEAEYDALGRVAKIAIEGKAGSSDGDSLLAPTEEFTYETARWTGAALPNRVKRKAREVHGTTTLFQESYTYTDGSGRVALVKIQAEPGKAPALDGNGNVIEIDADPRWVGSGNTVLNNKGNPVKQYEAFFSSTHEWENENAIRKWGVTAVVAYDALGRAKRTDSPNGSYRRATWTPWVREDFDENDTVLETGNLWYAARQPGASPTPSAAEQRAATLADDHADTPTLTHTDVLGRPFLIQADNGTTPLYDTRTKLDIEGHPLEVKDPLGRTCQTNKFSISGQLLKETNLDRGTRWMFANVAGNPIRRWDERDQTFRSVYDELQRPTHLYLKLGAAAETLLERRYYGEAASSPQTKNLRGQLILLFDQAGKLAFTSFDFKSNLRESSRKLATVYNGRIDWSALASITSPTTAESTAASSLETETFSEAREYDALNRITKLTTPDNSQHIPGYNRAALLETVDVKIRGATSATRFVRNIDSDAKGQRTKLELGNTSTVTTTTYSYDPLTFRLKALVTTRTSPSNTLQSLSYTYDPVGNIVAIADAAQQSVFYNANIIGADQAFEYDAVYRLKRADGREHTSLGLTVIGVDGAPLRNLPDPNSPAAVRRYFEQYQYDQVGNITSLYHEAAGSPADSWTRSYTYQTSPASNRLASTTGWASVPHDAHGNITSMPHLSSGITYSPFDQMVKANNGSQDTYFTYGADGQRVRKVYDTRANLLKERIYFGSYEIYRERVLTPTPAVQLERHTLHVMDGVRRIAMVETRTISGGLPVGSPVNLLRFQYTNHLGSAHLECDETGALISYEEMHPYGSSAYRSAPSASEVSARRYRYTGKERDEETGLDYFGARYYAPWLGRWTSADPLGLQAGLNLYLYARGSPINFVDPSGTQEVSVLTPEQQQKLGAAMSATPRWAPRPANSTSQDLGSGQVLTSEGYVVTEEMAAKMEGRGGGANPGASSVAEGVRLAVRNRVDATYEGVTEKPLETLTALYNPWALVGAVFGGAFNATTALLEASDETVEGKRNELYGEAIVSGIETGAAILGAKALEPGASTPKLTPKGKPGGGSGGGSPSGAGGGSGGRSGPRFPENPDELFPRDYAGLKTIRKPDGKITYEVKSGTDTFRVEYHPEHAAPLGEHFPGAHYHVRRRVELPNPGRAIVNWPRLRNLDPASPTTPGGKVFAPGDLLPWNRR